MNAGCLCAAVALWIVALVVGGHAESYPNRPTADELNSIVVQGTECVLGVNERCQATQNSPGSYQVSPPFVKTNDAGWYLDQNAMGAMAPKIRSLVPCYVGQDTVYDGTTNFVMLTVTGIWAELEIGNQISAFTAIPATGTNPPTYGDSPWRIYIEDLEERYAVLESLKSCRFFDKANIYNGEIKAIENGSNYIDSVIKFLAVNWVPDGGSVGIHAYMDSIGGDGSWRQDRVRGRFEILGGFTTNLTANKIEAYAYLGIPGESPFYGSDSACPGENNTYVQVIAIDNPNLTTFPYQDATFYGNSGAPIPDGSPSIFYGWFLGWSTLGKPNQTFITFDFQHCTD